LDIVALSWLPQNEGVREKSGKNKVNWEFWGNAGKMLGGFKSKYVIPQLIKEKLAFSRKNWSGKNGRSVRESRAIPKS